MIKRVLFITTVNPFYISTGGEVISSSIIKELSSRYDYVHVICYSRLGKRAKNNLSNVEVVSAGSIEVEFENAIVTTKLRWFISSILNNIPLSSAKYLSRRYVKIVKKYLASYIYDEVYVDHLNMIPVVRSILKDRKVSFIAHNIESKIYFDKEQGAIGFFKLIYSLEKRKVNKVEKNLNVSVNKIVCLSKKEAEYFQSYCDSVKVFKYAPSNRYVEEIVHSYDFGLIGSWTWKANRKGVDWFLEEVAPYLSSYRVAIAGKGSEQLNALEGIMRLGFVDSVESFYKEVKVILIPSTSGQGIQVKTLEALEFGKPVVLTSIAARGIDALPPWFYVVDDEKDFIRVSIELIDDYKRPSMEEVTEWLEEHKCH